MPSTVDYILYILTLTFFDRIIDLPLEEGVADRVGPAGWETSYNIQKFNFYTKK